MIAVAGNEHGNIRGGVFRDGLLNLFDKGARRVADIGACRLKRSEHIARHAVRPYNDHTAALGFAGRFDDGRAPFFQLLDDLRIMYQRPERAHFFAGIEQVVDHFQRAVDTETETGVAREFYCRQRSSSQSLVISSIMMRAASLTCAAGPSSSMPSDS